MDTPAIDWHARAAQQGYDGRAVIAGQRVASRDGETFDCVSPLNGRVLTTIARGRQADVDAAVASSRVAFESGRWARQPPAARKRVLLRFAEKILAARDELALVETMDMGKPVQYSRSVDVPSPLSTTSVSEKRAATELASSRTLGSDLNSKKSFRSSTP